MRRRAIECHAALRWRDGVFGGSGLHPPSEENKRSTAQILDALRAPPADHWWRRRNDQEVAVLDFGCGTGRLLRALLDEDMVSSAVGADVEEGMVSVFRQQIASIASKAIRSRIESVLLHEHDGSELPGIAKQPFDVVVTCYALGHIREAHINAAVHNLVRVIKPGGHLFVAEFDRIEDQVHGAAMHGHGSNHGGHHSHSHEHREHAGDVAHVSDGGSQHTNFNRQSLTVLLESAGLAIDRMNEHTLEIEDGKLNALGVYATKR